METRNRMVSKGVPQIKGRKEAEEINGIDDDQIPVSCPSRPSGGGRPPNTGVKSYLAQLSKDMKRRNSMIESEHNNNNVRR